MSFHPDDSPVQIKRVPARRSTQQQPTRIKGTDLDEEKSRFDQRYHLRKENDSLSNLLDGSHQRHPSPSFGHPIEANGVEATVKIREQIQQLNKSGLQQRSSAFRSVVDGAIGLSPNTSPIKPNVSQERLPPEATQETRNGVKCFSLTPGTKVPKSKESYNKSVGYKGTENGGSPIEHMNHGDAHALLRLEHKILPSLSEDQSIGSEATTDKNVGKDSFGQSFSQSSSSASSASAVSMSTSATATSARGIAVSSSSPSYHIFNREKNIWKSSSALSPCPTPSLSSQTHPLMQATPRAHGRSPRNDCSPHDALGIVDYLIDHSSPSNLPTLGQPNIHAQQSSNIGESHEQQKQKLIQQQTVHQYQSYSIHEQDAAVLKERYEDGQGEAASSRQHPQGSLIEPPLLGRVGISNQLSDFRKPEFGADPAVLLRFLLSASDDNNTSTDAFPSSLGASKQHSTNDNKERIEMASSDYMNIGSGFQSRVDSSIDSNTPLTPAFLHSKVYGANVADSEEFSLTSSSVASSLNVGSSLGLSLALAGFESGKGSARTGLSDRGARTFSSSASFEPDPRQQLFPQQRFSVGWGTASADCGEVHAASSVRNFATNIVDAHSLQPHQQLQQPTRSHQQYLSDQVSAGERGSAIEGILERRVLGGGIEYLQSSVDSNQYSSSSTIASSFSPPSLPHSSHHFERNSSIFGYLPGSDVRLGDRQPTASGHETASSADGGGAASGVDDIFAVAGSSSQLSASAAPVSTDSIAAFSMPNSSSSQSVRSLLPTSSGNTDNGSSRHLAEVGGSIGGSTSAVPPSLAPPKFDNDFDTSFEMAQRSSRRRQLVDPWGVQVHGIGYGLPPTTSATATLSSLQDTTHLPPPHHHPPPPDHHDHHHHSHPLENSADSPFHVMPPPQSTAATRGSQFIHGTMGDSTIGDTRGGASWSFDRTASFGKPPRASDSEAEHMRIVPQLSNSAPSFVPARTVSYQETHRYAYSHSQNELAADPQRLPPNLDDRRSALPVQHQAQPPALPYSSTFDHTNLGHYEPREHYRQLQQGGDLQCSVDSQLSRMQMHRAVGAQQMETLHTRTAYIGGAHSQAYLPPTHQQQFIQQFTRLQHPGSSQQVDYNQHHHSIQSHQYQQPHSQHQRIPVTSQTQSLPPPVLAPHSNYSTSTSVFGGSDHPSQSAVQLSAGSFHAPSSGAVSVSSSFGSVDSETSFAQSVSSSISFSRHLQPATSDTTTSSDHRYSSHNAQSCGGRPSLGAGAPAEQLRSSDMYDGIATNDDSGTNDFNGDGNYINGGKGSTKSIDSRSRALIGSGKQAVREQRVRYDTTTTVNDMNGSRELVGGSSLERMREKDTAVASSQPNQSFAPPTTANTGTKGGKKASKDKTGVSKPTTHSIPATTASDKSKADVQVDKVVYGPLSMKSQQENCSNAALATAQASEVNPISSRPPAPAPVPFAPSANNATSIAGTSNSTSSNSFYNFSSRAELVESPRSKVAHKEFFKHFRQRERESVDVAVQYAIDALETVPANAKWRVYLELADISKRNNNLEEARKYYASVCSTQPRASMGWIEWSKMEEENGKIRLALNILILGLKVCKISEALVTRVIKLHERLHKYKEVRSMLSMLKHESIDRVWKSVLEGSLFEARTGNIAVSRKLLRYLMKNVPWYGPIYYEAFRLEERENADDAALAIIHRGLTDLPRYGPLWFGLLRMMEKHDTRDEIHGWMTGAAVPRLRRLRREAVSALSLISKELVWKVHFELSQAEERAAEIAAQGHFGRLKFYPGEGKDLMSCTPPRQHHLKEAHYSESTRPILWEDNQFVRNNEALARITASARSSSSTAARVTVESIDKPEAFSLPNAIESMRTISSRAREGCEGEEVGPMAVRHPQPFSLANVRGLLLQPARRALVKGLLICPSNLRWKLFLVGARLELSVGSIDKCRRLLQRAFVEVPIKSKAFVYLECARLEEYLSGVRLARELLSVARREVSSEWKLYLESILLEVRNGDILYALQLAAEAVQEHSGTGRLWAVYIQLCHRLENQPRLEEAARKGEDLEAALQQRIPLADQQQQQQGRTVVVSSAFHTPVRTRRKNAFSSSPAGLEQHGKGNVPLEPGAAVINKTAASTAAPPRPTARESVVRRAPATYRIMRLAIAQVPKSGEVWCERARCHLNPFNVNLFDLRKAQRSLAFAIQFTPQYGDTFIEYLRTEVLSQVLLPALCMALRVPVWPFLRHSLCVDQEGDVADCCERAKLLGICAETPLLSGGGASRAEGTSTATVASPGVVSCTRELIQLPDDSKATSSTQQHSLLTGGKPRSLADSCEEEMFVRLPLLPPAPPTTSATAAAASLSPYSVSSRRQEGSTDVYNNASRDRSASQASTVASSHSSHCSQAACEQPQQEIYIDGKRPDVPCSGQRTEPLRGQDFCRNEEECEVEIATMPVPGPATDRATRREVILAIERMEYDFGHLTPFIAHHVQLKHLSRRCVNADPNYGSAWFHCRRHPNENPIHVLENAHATIAHDLVAAQSIYARALLRFLRRCLLHKKQHVRPPASVNSSNPSSSASSGAAAGTNTVPSASASASRIQGGNTHTVHWSDRANSSPSSSSSSDNNSGSSMNINNGAPGFLSAGTKKEDFSMGEFDPDRLRMRQRALEDELLEDFDFVNAHLLLSPHSISPLTERDDKACQKATGGSCDEGTVHETDERAKAGVVRGGSVEDASLLTRTSLSWPGFDEDHYIPGIETDTGRVLTSAEFVTGVLGLNRLVYNKALTAEEKRKHLFGSDQLIS